MIYQLPSATRKDVPTLQLSARDRRTWVESPILPRFIFKTSQQQTKREAPWMLWFQVAAQLPGGTGQVRSSASRPVRHAFGRPTCEFTRRIVVFCPTSSWNPLTGAALNRKTASWLSESKRERKPISWVTEEMCSRLSTRTSTWPG